MDLFGRPFSFWVQCLLKDLVSLLFFPITCLHRLFRASSGVRILVYHTVQQLSPQEDPIRLSISAALLRTHLKSLHRFGFVIVPLAAVLDHVKGKHRLSPRSVALTFDDGYADHFAVVRPLLEEFGVSATFFVICRAIETGKTVDGLKGDSSLRQSMSLDQVRSLCEGGMDIGSHSMTHTCLSELDDGRMAEEVFGSKRYLEEKLGKSVKMFAYPFGAYRTFNGRTRAQLEAAGYGGACINLLGWNRPGDDPFTLRRTRIGWDDRSWRFFLKVFGAYDWIDASWIRQFSGRLSSIVREGSVQ